MKTTFSTRPTDQEIVSRLKKDTRFASSFFYAKKPDPGKNIYPLICSIAATLKSSYRVSVPFNDIASIIYLKLWSGGTWSTLDKFSFTSSIFTWLYKVAYREVIDKCTQLGYISNKHNAFASDFLTEDTSCTNKQTKTFVSLDAVYHLTNDDEEIEHYHGFMKLGLDPEDPYLDIILRKKLLDFSNNMSWTDTIYQEVWQMRNLEGLDGDEVTKLYPKKNRNWTNVRNSRAKNQFNEEFLKAFTR